MKKNYDANFISQRVVPRGASPTINPDMVDPTFYRKAYKEVSTQRVDPIRYYYSHGKSKDHLPNSNVFWKLYPKFDPVIYARYNGDLKSFTLEELMSHFHHNGRKEQRIFESSMVNPTTKPHKSEPHPLTHKTASSPSFPTSFVKVPVPVLTTTPTSTSPSASASASASASVSTSASAAVSALVPSETTSIVVPSPSNQTYINPINYVKIENYQNTHYGLYLDPLLQSILDKKPTKPIYLVLSEWGYPSFGGGECWLFDTTKWMATCGFECYYLYFSLPETPRVGFDHYELIPTEFCQYIRCPRETLSLLNFLKQLNPRLISHQGLNRGWFLMLAHLLERPFMTGFCFWQDIIDPASMKNGIYNQNMLTRELIPDPNFKEIILNSTASYVASPFMAELVQKLHHVDMDVINTISDDTQYRFAQPQNSVYVSVINICRLKGGEMLEAIVKGVSRDIPFLFVDYQETDSELNRHLKQLLIERNSFETEHKSVYIKGPITDMTTIYQQTRILLIPTLVDETFCRVAYEGMMNSLPILSTTCGNLRYLVGSYAEFLSASDPSEWVNKINQIYHNPETLKELSQRQKTMEPTRDLGRFINLTRQSMIHRNAAYLRPTHVGLLCPWADQGLGIQCREYYQILNNNGYQVSVYSYRPYHANHENPKLQTDLKEWDFPNIYYATQVREEIEIDDFLRYIHQFQVGQMIIVETCYSKVFQLAQLCHLLGIRVIAIPNVETLKYSEIYQHAVFDTIACNNQMTYDILLKYFPTKVQLVGFRIMHPYFSLSKTWSDENQFSFFCSGGLNAISRKNIDKIMSAFHELETENRVGSFKLYVYIQGCEIPKQIAQLKSSNLIINVGQKTYQEIVKLYLQHDIFIHMGDHEGLGLGFYESIVCGTPVFTIDTPPNNEIIRENRNGWLIPCTHVPLSDNKEGITHQATIQVVDLKNKMAEIMAHYDRKTCYHSTLHDYLCRYPIEIYNQQIRKMLNFNF